jgi:hypothetical protein
MHVACTDIDGFSDPEYISSYFARPFFTTVSFLRDYLLFIFFTLRLLPLYTYSYPSSRLLVIFTLSSFSFVADAVSALFFQLSCQFCIWFGYVPLAHLSPCCAVSSVLYPLFSHLLDICTLASPSIMLSEISPLLYLSDDLVREHLPSVSRHMFPFQRVCLSEYGGETRNFQTLLCQAKGCIAAYYIKCIIARAHT